MHVQVPDFLRSSTQDPIGLPDCAIDCFKTVEPDASKWGCTGSGYACLCDISWFFAGYNICARESCTADDILAAEKRIQSHCDVLNKRDLSSSSSFAQAMTPLSNIPVSTVFPITTSTTSPPIVAPDGSTVNSTQISTTSVTPSGSSATTSSTHAPSSLSQPAKIGMGLGVPLGVIVLAVFGCALYWFGKKSGKSRGNNKTGLNESGTEKKDPVDVGAMNYTLEGGELHGQHVVHHPKELPGSPGSVRMELP